MVYTNIVAQYFSGETQANLHTTLNHHGAAAMPGTGLTATL
ncbi:hypothetical protein [Gymnodinialimonas phycosphaerae]|nr:hypothetical protein [Gymnodinialimonas phycosphaerae]